ncbi:MetQ/NlpA family ABC transporter substrate-binding protein [Clostridium celatum]|uniref:Lipoprotein n=1 Tax=Clostridium celatum DSM 1785 TaxID=545697 RepID=L1QAY8_9CLOT|nr:MetQ/NlpA family ABC transporter substrate-binding protein [Clostridium celatum]EKY25121.1 NLPA lipoprotein [Clostridium celatum DSM 1785]MCE9655922.1 MetQ/NlpA family ABC transporter substrate-binding protein [Clostridium celatum]MDU3722934.1 MetQ/NlpA family ABC transporter substrate-binding protein [Clostridium celatum]MDU6294851.1 MetQ/NlpA family ABC transporter substrate-binding protein [Clostridium celatum]
MKKKILAGILAGVLSLGLIGCGSNGATSNEGSNSSDDKIIKIGVSPEPHASIVEVAKPLLEEKGYTVEIVEFNDYVLPNTAVEEGELDANYFQTIAYLESFNDEKDTHLTYTAEIHLEPMGAFSNKYKSLDEVEDGATVAIPDDTSNEARALKVLAAAGLIEINDGDLITVADITSNPKNLNFKVLEAATLPRVLEEVDIAVINGNYALEAGLDVNNDTICKEDKDADDLQGRRNVLAVKEGNENTQKIKDLTEALTSDEVREFIEKEYNGAVVPVF